ncbi:MAG: glycosyltransferase, partial [Candidatus Levyibacteriota bacterium]
FIPLLLHEQGFKVTEVPVTHDKRKFGKSKFGISKVFKDLPDIFTMIFLNKYSKRPLHFFGTIGGFMLFIGTLISLYLTTLWFQGESIGRRPLLLFGILLIVVGLQTFLTGFLADLFIHISKNGKAEERDKFSIKYSSS